tara:strand:- start:372 stop:503 length:132 start_codon:yes stop_codon:yes gene_type:complete
MIKEKHIENTILCIAIILMFADISTATSVAGAIWFGGIIGKGA